MGTRRLLNAVSHQLGNKSQGMKGRLEAEDFQVPAWRVHE